MTERNEETILEIPTKLGSRLKQAREDKKLSISEVAKQLKFMKENIQALEDSQWDKLYGRAYARGYLSSYIKILGLPEEDILLAFDREYVSSSSDLSLSNVAQIEETTDFPWLKLFIIIFIFIIALVLYQKKEALSDFIEGIVTGEYIFSDDKTETLILKEVEEESIIYYEPVVVENERAVQEPINVDVAIFEGDSGSEEGVSSLDFEDPTREEESYIQEISTVLESQINLSFSQNCWVEIIDADMNVLSNELVMAGSNLDLKGRSPLTILLGNSVGVTAKINGQENAFDMSQYTFENVTRFSLEGKM